MKFFMSILLFPLGVFGSRQIVLPPINYYTVHGAVLCANPATGNYQTPYGLLNIILSQTASPAVPPASALPACSQVGYCGTADMIGLEKNDFRGVICSRHQFFIAVANLASISQTVTVTLKHGSKISTSKNSVLKVGSLVPDAIGNTLVMPDTSQTKTLAPVGASGDSTTFEFGFSCDGTNCQLGAICPDIFTNTVCLSHSSVVIFGISIAEDSGLLQGTVSYRASRHWGEKDKYGEFTVLQIVGGRPF